MPFEPESIEDTALIALGDQVQEQVSRSEQDIVGFILFRSDGTVEMRTPLDYAVLAEAIKELANAL